MALLVGMQITQGPTCMTPSLREPVTVVIVERAHNLRMRTALRQAIARQFTGVR